MPDRDEDELRVIGQVAWLSPPIAWAVEFYWDHGEVAPLARAYARDASPENLKALEQELAKREIFEERAGGREHDAGLDRDEAEAEARAEMGETVEEDKEDIWF